MNNFEDCKIKEVTTLVVRIPKTLSNSIDHKLLDLSELGVKLTKSEYVSRCIESGHKTLTFES